MPKPIKLKRSQVIGRGCFGEVYRISQRRVIKVMRGVYLKDADHYIEDEIKGSKEAEHCLPVLDVVDVELWDYNRNKVQTKGMVKRYLPLECTRKEEGFFYKKYKDHRICWDIKNDNIRKDSRGKLFIIDTQWRPN